MSKRLFCIFLSVATCFLCCACGLVKEIETNDYSKFFTEKIGEQKFFPSAQLFGTEDYEFYRYYINMSSISNETFLKLTYSDTDVYEEKLKTYLKDKGYTSYQSPFNEKYVEYFFYPVTGVTSGKEFFASYSFNEYENKYYVPDFKYTCIAASKDDKTIIFYDGYITDNNVFRHYPKYLSNYNYIVKTTGNFFVWA